MFEAAPLQITCVSRCPPTASWRVWNVTVAFPWEGGNPGSPVSPAGSRRWAPYRHSSEQESGSRGLLSCSGGRGLRVLLLRPRLSLTLFVGSLETRQGHKSSLPARPSHTPGRGAWPSRCCGWMWTHGAPPASPGSTAGRSH